MREGDWMPREDGQAYWTGPIQSPTGQVEKKKEQNQQAAETPTEYTKGWEMVEEVDEKGMDLVRKPITIVKNIKVIRV